MSQENEPKPTQPSLHDAPTVPLNAPPASPQPASPQPLSPPPPVAKQPSEPKPAAEQKLWGGRFSQPVNKLAEEFGASIGFDQRLYREDIAGSIAHAHMLGKQKIIPEADVTQIVEGLSRIRERIGRGEFDFRTDREDIHLNIEAALHDEIGEAAGRLHTARSRNDQIALDLRLFTRRAIADIITALSDMQTTLVRLADQWLGVIVPGYTHLQRAQPILFSHHLLAWFEMVQRDIGRFYDAYNRVDVMPLGAGALAGVPYPIDRAAVAAELGFSELTRNSLDAVSDRDFVVEFVAAAALSAVHLSRICEELVLWSSAEFGFVELSDTLTTGSSIMPQKKNPDFAELIRGKSGRMIGHLVGLLTLLKGLPLAYNKDMQEDKEPIFDSYDTLLASLRVMNAMLATMTINGGRMYRAASDSMLIATDLADYLVGKGVPFRRAHEVIGRLVRAALENNQKLTDLSLDALRTYAPEFEQDVFAVTLESSVNARQSYGGTAMPQVRGAIDSAREIVQETRKWLTDLPDSVKG